MTDTIPLSALPDPSLVRVSPHVIHNDSEKDTRSDMKNL